MFYRSDDDDLLDDASHEVLNVAEVPLLSLDEAMAAIAVGKEDHVQEQCDALSDASGSGSSSDEDDPVAKYRRWLLSTWEVVRYLRQKHEQDRDRGR